MRSASRIAVPVAAVALAPVLAGCVSTQTKNARTLLVSARTLAAQKAVHVSAGDAQVTVTGVTLIQAAHRTAFVVSLQNRAGTPLSDLPIAVGVHSGRTEKQLNGRANLAYFDTHVASIAAHGSATWVFVSRHTVPRHARAYATVGAATTPASTTVSSLPRLTVSAGHATKAATELQLNLHNTTSVPQYGVPVYAVGTRNGRIVAAGYGSLGSLGGGSTASVALRLIGSPGQATLQLSAPATIFK